MNLSLEIFEILERLTDPEVKSNPTKRMELMVQFLKRYIDTYEDQYEYQNYSDSTLIDDILYGLGVALNPEEHRFASGFDTFKSKLIEHLNTTMIEYTFKTEEEVIEVYGEPLIARRTSKISIREVEGEKEVFKYLTGDDLIAVKDVDWVMLPENHPPYPCKKDIFNRSWEPIPENPGFYRRSALAKVVPIPEGHTVTLETLEGPVTVTYPSYIAIGIDGEVYPNSQEWVKNNLEFI